MGGQPYLSTSTTPISPEDGTNNFAITVPTLPTGFTLAHGSTSCPSIASAGDGNGGYIHPALYTLCTVNGVQKILDIFININPTGTSSNPDVNDLNQGTPVQITPSLPAGVTLTQIS